MAPQLVSRPQRTWPERQPPPTDLTLDSPPRATDVTGWLQALAPLASCLFIGVYVFLWRNVAMMVVIVVAVVLSVGINFAGRVQQRRSHRSRGRRAQLLYRQDLDELEQQLEAMAEGLVRYLRALYPGPRQLSDFVLDRERRWERRRDDPDFGCVAVGEGKIAPDWTVRHDLFRRHPDADPALVADARSILAKFNRVDAPVAIPLLSYGVVGLVGPLVVSRPHVRGLLAQLMAHTAPTDLRIIALTQESTAEWPLTWPQHVRHPHRPTVVTTTSDVSRFARHLADIVEMRTKHLGLLKKQNLLTAPSWTHVVVVIDNYRLDGPVASHPVIQSALAHAHEIGMTVLCLVEKSDQRPSRTDATVRYLSDECCEFVESTADGRRERDICPYRFDVDNFDRFTRIVGQWRLANDEAPTASGDPLSITALYGARTTDDLIRKPWTDRPEKFLRVKVGLDHRGLPFYLDLNEAAQPGDGPHGWILGPTGWGKSVFAQTLVVSLALTHDPRFVQFVLIDWNEGSSLLPFARLPHTAGMITNFRDDLAEVDRAFAALEGVRARRQALFGTQSIYEYNESHPSGRQPHLVVLIEEVSQLVQERAEAASLIQHLARQGRKVGIHLVLISQTEVNQGDLATNTDFRVWVGPHGEETALRGAVAPDRLPSVAGVGSMTTKRGESTAFKTATARLPATTATADSGALVRRWNPEGETASNAVTGARTELVTIADTLAAATKFRATRVCTPPLPHALRLDELTDDVPVPSEGSVAAAVGKLDVPSELHEGPFIVGFGPDAPNLAIVGAPGPDVPQFLASTVAALALKQSPEQLQFLVFDMMGSLHWLAELPHVREVCPRSDSDLVRLALSEAERLCDVRPKLLKRQGPRRWADFVTAHLGSAETASTVVVIDSWASFREDYPDYIPVVLDIARRGTHFGVYLLIGANRWLDLPPTLSENIATRLQLKLSDEDSSDRQWKLDAARIKSAPTGRGICGVGKHFQTAEARWGEDDADGSKLIGELRRRWDGHQPATGLDALPSSVPETDLPIDSHLVTIGLAEGRGTAQLDFFGEDPHLVVYGQTKAGKTNALALVARRARRIGRGSVEVWSICRKPDLLQVLGDDGVTHTAGTDDEAGDLVAALTTTLKERTAALRTAWANDNSNSSGPHEILLLVDDYHLIPTGAGKLLSPLEPFVALGQQLRFHVVLARQHRGSNRSNGTDPVLRALLEGGAPVLLLDGDPTEPPVVETHRAAHQDDPGRGLLVRREHRPVLVQLGHVRLEQPTRERTA